MATDKKQSIKKAVAVPGSNDPLPRGSENVVVVSGRVRVDPVRRSLPSDDVLLTFDLVSGVDGDRRTVPVSWQGPPRSLPKLGPDDRVMVLGTVQRRFFRAGGATAHATDVRAEIVARTPAAKRKLTTAALARLHSLG